MPAPALQSQRSGDNEAEGRRDGDLRNGARQRDSANRQQVVQGKLQSDAEHQQHDADLRQLP